MLRLFVAVPIPDEARKALARLQSGLRGAHWVRPENFHLSLAFVGEVDEAQAEDIDAALAAIRAPVFDLRLRHMGSFGSGQKVRALWAGAEPCEPLIRLQAKVEVALKHAGVALEPRKFKPHVTLARFQQGRFADVGPFIGLHDGFLLEHFEVEHFVLYRSHLGKGAAVYEVLAEYPLIRS